MKTLLTFIAFFAFLFGAMAQEKTTVEHESLLIELDKSEKELFLTNNSEVVNYSIRVYNKSEYNNTSLPLAGINLDKRREVISFEDEQVVITILNLTTQERKVFEMSSILNEAN